MKDTMGTEHNDQLTRIEDALKSLTSNVGHLLVETAVIKQRLSEGDEKFKGLQCNVHVSRVAELSREVESLKAVMHPIRLSVFGFIGLMMSGAVGAAIAKLFSK